MSIHYRFFVWIKSPNLSTSSTIRHCLAIKLAMFNLDRKLYSRTWDSWQSNPHLTHIKEIYLWQTLSYSQLPHQEGWNQETGEKSALTNKEEPPCNLSNKNSNNLATGDYMLLCIWWRLVSGWTSIAIIIPTIASLGSIRATRSIPRSTHIINREWVVLSGNSSRTLTVGHSIAGSIRACTGTLVHALARIAVRPRISCSGALCWRSRVPPAKRRVGIRKFSCFGWTERRWATSSATTSTISSLILRLTGSCWTLFPFYLGFLQMSSSLPQAIKGKFRFKLVVFHTFDYGSNGIQLQSTGLLLKGWIIITNQTMNTPTHIITSKCCRGNLICTYRCRHAIVSILQYGASILFGVLKIWLDQRNRRKSVGQTSLRSKIHSFYFFTTLHQFINNICTIRAVFNKEDAENE